MASQVTLDEAQLRAVWTLELRQLASTLVALVGMEV